MAQDQTPEKDQVLIAHNKETGETGAVAGLKEDGTPAMADTKTSKLSDLVVFNLHKNPLEAFMSNFLRQCKNPSKFGFYKLDAENLNTVGPVMQDALKDPEANKAMLDPSKVEVKAENRNYHKIDADKIDWNTLKERWGIDRDELEKRGDLQEMMYNRKSGLINIRVNVDGEMKTAAARLAFKTDENGNVKVVPSFVCEKPDLSQEFNGVKFSERDKLNLVKTGNLGRIADVVDRQTGEVVPSFISIDRLTNEIVSVPAKQVYVRDTVGQTKLTMAEINTLKSGQPIKDKQITDRNGKQYTVALQVNADSRRVEFVPDEKKQRQSQNQGESNEKTRRQSTWINNDRVLLESKTFRLNYTARSSGAHKFLVVVQDNFESTPWEMTFEFNGKDSDDDGGKVIDPIVVGPVTPIIK